MANHTKSPGAAGTGKRPASNADPAAADHRKRPRSRRPPRVFASLPDEHLITMRELEERVPLDRLTIRRLVQEGRFPPPLQLTRSRIAWKWSAILRWIAEREADPIERRRYFGLP